MSESVKVSVIIPVYNVEQYLRECLDSVVNQTLKELEIICVNDGSTDGSLAILKEYAMNDDRIRIIDKPNAGYGHTMNIGINEATGKYVAFLESDDYVRVDMYELLYDICVQNDLEIVKGDFCRFYGDGEDRQIDNDSITHYMPLYNKVLDPSTEPDLLDCGLYTWAGLYSREFLNRHNIRHNETPGASYQDNGFWFQTFCLARRLMFVDQVLYHLRRDNPNSSFFSKGKVFSICHEYMFIAEFLKRYPEIRERFIYKYQKVKYGSYMFTYRRVAEEYKLQFLRNMGAEFYQAKLAGELQEEYFTKGQWDTVNNIIKDPDIWYTKALIREGKKEPLKDLRSIKNQLELAEKEIQEIKSSMTYRIGRLFTWLPRNIRGTIRCYRDNGLRYTVRHFCKRVFEKKKKMDNAFISKVRERGFRDSIRHIYLKYAPKVVLPFRELPQKQSLRVLFIASDNNSSSGAFLSMTMLNKLLQEQHGVETYVILPCEGTGKELLDEYHINNKIIYSYNWIVRNEINRDSSFWKKIKKEKTINQRATRQIARFAKRESFDIIHINTTYSYIGALAAKQVAIPTVWHLREFVEEDQNRTMWDRSHGNQLISEVDRVIAISQGVYNKYLPIIRSDKLRKIYNGLDINIFHRPEKQIFSNDKVIFIFVGTINLNKGQIHLAEACSKLIQSGFDNFEIWYIGTSNETEMERIRKVARRAGFLDKIQFLGYQRNTASFYEKADISFTCSKFEAFGRTTVEAMLAGNLVIGADTGGTQELIDDGKTGILYKQGDTNDLFKKIIYALENKELMRNIALAGRLYMAENMTASLNANNIYNLYAELSDINNAFSEAAYKSCSRNTGM